MAQRARGLVALFRRDALAGQSEALADEIEQAMQVATVQLNNEPNLGIWGRPPKTRRHLHRLFVTAFEEQSSRGLRGDKLSDELSGAVLEQIGW